MDPTQQPGIDINVLIAGIVLMILLVIAVGVILFWKTFNKPRYRATPIMTGNEVEFFGRLQRALPECYVFPQIAMSALITPTAKGKRWRSDFGRISQKRVDWALYAKQGLKLVAIVELDDRTHNAEADAKRDAMTGSAGIRTLRFESKKKPAEREIRAIVGPLIARAS